MRFPTPTARAGASAFKKYLRDNLINCTTKLRLHKSFSTQLDSDRTISDLAYAHRFNGASYYYKTFKKNYRESPNMYKNRVLYC